MLGSVGICHFEKTDNSTHVSENHTSNNEDSIKDKTNFNFNSP